AISRLTKATQKNYLAAYDNLGWALIRKRNEKLAIATFEAGIKAGDPSCMTSLASILENKHNGPGYSVTAIRLYAKAASLGNQDASRRLEEIASEKAQFEEEQLRIAEQQRKNNEAAAQIFGLGLGIVDGLIQNRRK
ncbi:MAG: hypothetical protein KDJ16_13480, partial [Hyphomicrobiales bacterium]|nr:hypothetical protein [Hyphomicrobiales bacterium]